MRKLALFVMVALILAGAGTTWATAVGPRPYGNQFTIPADDLVTMARIHPNDPGWHPEGVLTGQRRISADVAQFDFTLLPDSTYDADDPDPGNRDGFRDFQVGWAAIYPGMGDLPPEYYDLSAYESVTLSFHNLSEFPIWVNVFMNTGWTAGGYTDPDNYYQNGWVELPGYCDWAILDLDFTGVQNLNHVSALGFTIASQYLPEASIMGHMEVDAVPEPVTMLSAFLAIGGLGAYMRKRTRVA